MTQSKIGVGTYMVSRVFDDRHDIESVVASYIAERMDDEDEKFDEPRLDMV